MAGAGKSRRVPGQGAVFLGTWGPLRGLGVGRKGDVKGKRGELERI